MSKIVKTIQINGEEIIFRYPVSEDAPAMCAYINTLSLERTFIRFQGEQMSLDEENKYLAGQIQKIAEKKAIKILVYHNKELIGLADVNLGEKTERHLGLFGITIKKEWRNKGLGRQLMAVTLDEAKKKLTGLKIITLGVFANNPQAIKLYESFGFKQYGYLPQGIALEKDYIDHINMYLPTTNNA